MPIASMASAALGFGRSQRSPITTTNMLLYLDAGNTASYPGSGTTWTDLSTNANNATSLTGVTYSSSNGGYLSFDGSTGSGSLVASKYNQTYTGKTIFIVGNLTSIAATNYRAMLGASSGSRNFNLYMYSPALNRYQLHFSSGGIGTLSSDVTYTPGNWFTAAVTHQTNGTVTYYFNGTLVNTDSQTFYQYLSPSTEHVGRADNFWNGPLSVICVYKAALSAAEILNNHNSVRGRYGLN
jgi:hypothetical protein